MNTKYLVIIRQAKFKGKTQNVPSSLKHVLSGGDLSRADVRERVSVACPARSSLSHAPIEGGVQVLKIHSKYTMHRTTRENVVTVCVKSPSFRRT